MIESLIFGKLIALHITIQVLYYVALKQIYTYIIYLFEFVGKTPTYIKKS